MEKRLAQLQGVVILTMSEFKLRPYQADAVERILSALERGSVAFQSPTGSGKTLVALEVMRRLGPSSAFTRTLSQYEPWEREVRRLGLMLGGLAGKDRFCLRPMTKRDGESVRITRCFSCPFAFNSYDRSRLQELGVVGFLSWLRGKDECGYGWLRFLDANVYLYTYPYFFFYRKMVRGNALLVFDEAHNLVSVGDMVGVEITADRLRAIRRDYEGTDVQEIVSTALDAVESWALHGAASGSRPPDADEFELEAVEDHRISSVFHALSKVGHPAYKVYARPDGVSIRLMDPAEELSKLNEEKWLMMSGTLPSEGYMRRVWGLQDFQVVEVRPYRMKFSYFWDRDHSTRLTERKSARSGYVRAVSKLKGKGLTLVLTPSYEVASWFKGIADYVESRESAPSDVPREGLVVAVARGKLSEGVEFVEDGRSLIKRVVIVGIPYPNVGDPYVRDEVEFLSKKLGSRSRWFLLREDALLIIRQAMGRAIRNQEDSAEVYFLDRRAGPFLRRLGLNPKRVRLVDL